LTGDAVGTSGAAIPLLNGTNTWSGSQTFTNIYINLLGSSDHLPAIQPSRRRTPDHQITLSIPLPILVMP
jgi:hypothetical protein